jgi:multidrug resistance efflux pump
MKADFCVYPPQLARDLEITEQRDGDRPVFIVGSASVGRYLLLRSVERRALGLLDAGLAPGEVCAEFRRRYGGTLSLTNLSKFLTRLDEFGVLAGHRGQNKRPSGFGSNAELYARFKLFNPDPLFARMVGALRWVWTTWFFAVSLSLMLIAAALAAMNAPEVARYTAYTLREHYVAVLLAGLLVGVAHEFAHGLTCKAFGGRATEVGVMMIYYFLPAFYCDVSSIHLIPQRGRRLWVIAAGVYWQLMVGAVSLLAWFALAPYTAPSDLAFVFFCGGALDVFFNGNPLIKLDGYYFLSQWLRTPNLMDRGRAWWRGALRRLFFGEPNAAAAQFSRRERTILALFGLLSFAYASALRILIVLFLGAYLIDWAYLPGLSLTMALAIFYVRRPIGRILKVSIAELRAVVVEIRRSLFKQPGRSQTMERLEGDMSTENHAIQTGATGDPAERSAGVKTTLGREKLPSRWRRRIVPLSAAVFAVVILRLPWNASIGNYGTLIAIPGQESIIRAPESATLTDLRVRPGDVTASGAVIGRMGAMDLDERLAQLQAELDRANADLDRLQGDLKAREEAITRAEVSLGQRRSEFEESEFERRQIETRTRADANAANLKYFIASSGPAPGGAAPGPAPFVAGLTSSDTPAAYPAAIAVLQSEAELRRAKLEESRLQLERARALNAQGIVPRSELDGAETRAATLALDFAGARQRLEAALVEHRRNHTRLATDVRLAGSDLGAGKLEVDKLAGESRAVRALISTLTERRDLLRHRLARFELVAPRDGVVFGEELPRMSGQYFPKGAEICRVVDTRRLLARIQAPEREIGDVRPGQPVRLKVRAYPDRVFHGSVTKIGGEGEPDPNNQVVYRVELVIENSDGLLRPGMTAFARVDFGRRPIAAILLHKLKQILRPELWMM